MGAGRRIGLGVDDQHVGHRAVGDPEFGAVEDEAIAAPVGPELHRDDVGAGARLRHGKRPDMLARDQLGQVAPLVLVAAIAPDLVDAEIGMGAIGQPDRRRAAADLLHGDAVLEIAEPGSAMLLLDGDPEDAEGAELRPQGAGEFIAAVDLGRDRRDMVVAERPHAVADHVGGLAEAEIQHRIAVAGHYAPVSPVAVCSLSHFPAPQPTASRSPAATSTTMPQARERRKIPPHRSPW